MTATKEATSIDVTEKLMVVLKEKTAQLKNETKEQEAALKKAFVAAERKGSNNKSARKQMELADTSDASDPDCLIKGNINRDGERIYHTPWSSPHYKRTKINIKKGERWFCTEGEARQAGWRAPYR